MHDRLSLKDMCLASHSMEYLLFNDSLIYYILCVILCVTLKSDTTVFTGLHFRTI